MTKIDANSHHNNTICIVMPCFNTLPEYLNVALQSIFIEKSLIEKQGYVVLLLIVDDASTSTETIAVLDGIKYSCEWIKVIRLEKNLGPAGARNQALNICGNFNWITFLDSDDYWLYGGISSLCEFLNTNSSVKWISGDFFIQNDIDKHEKETFYQSHSERYKYIKSAFESGTPLKLERPIEAFLDMSLCSMGSCIISREVLDNVGLFNAQLRKGVDTELYWRLSRNYDMVFFPSPIFVYRRHADSVSFDGQRISDWEPPIIRSMMRDAGWKPYRSLLKRRLIRTLMSLSFAAGKRGEGGNSIYLAIQALMLKPYGRLPWIYLFSSISTFYSRIFSRLW